MPNACLMASFLNFHGLEIYVVIISILDIKFCIRFCWAMLSGNFSVCCCCWIFFMKATFVQQTDSSSPSVSISPSLVPFLSLSLLCLSTSICNCLCLFHFFYLILKWGISRTRMFVFLSISVGLCSSVLMPLSLFVCLRTSLPLQSSL